jgi:hypothetical protein
LCGGGSPSNSSTVSGNVDVMALGVCEGKIICVNVASEERGELKRDGLPRN